MSSLDSVVGWAMRPFLRAVSRSRLPQMQGTQKLTGLADHVEVFRDSWGIPHIYAGNILDLLRAQGYARP